MPHLAGTSKPVHHVTNARGRKIMKPSMTTATEASVAKTGTLPPSISETIKPPPIKKTSTVSMKTAFTSTVTASMSNVVKQKDVHCNSPDTVIPDLQTTHCSVQDMTDVSSKGEKVKCWSCEVYLDRCSACVFNDVKAGKDVDKKVLAKAVHTHEQILGACNMALIQKHVDTNAKFQEILLVLQTMFMNLQMLSKITDNTLKYTGDNGISALLHNYRVHFDVLLKNAGDVCNISLLALNTPN